MKVVQKEAEGKRGLCRLPGTVGSFEAGGLESRKDHGEHKLADTSLHVLCKRYSDINLPFIRNDDV